jgi:hypothetical protein
LYQSFTNQVDWLSRFKILTASSTMAQFRVYNTYGEQRVSVVFSRAMVPTVQGSFQIPPSSFLAMRRHQSTFSFAILLLTFILLFYCQLLFSAA